MNQLSILATVVGKKKRWLTTEAAGKTPSDEAQIGRYLHDSKN